MHLVASDSEGRVVGALEVRPEPQTIGRSKGCGLVIDGQGVSRIHASVYLHEDRVVIADAGSANGVRLDGHIIAHPSFVERRSVVQISSFRLTLREAGPQRAQRDPEDDPTVQHEEAAETAQEETSNGRQTFLEAPAVVVRKPAGALALVGRGGPYDNARFVLEDILVSVGRDEDNQIVLEDPSVSRRHAQLRVSEQGERLTVLDLRSSNGTHVHGDRIKRAEIRVGDLVRFGDLAFRLLSDAKTATRERAGRSTRARLVITLVAVTLALGGLGVVAYLKRPKPVVVKALTPEELLRKRQARIQRMVEEAKRKIASRQWSAAIVVIDEVLKQDPFNTEPKRMRVVALEELGHQKTFDDAMKFFALGNTDNLKKARELFAQVPRSSIYSRETRYKLRTIDERLAEGYRIDGVSRCKARYYRRCYTLLCKYFSLMPSDVTVPGEPGLRREMVAIERRYRRSSSFRSCRAARYVARPVVGASGRSTRELLAEKYPQASIQEVADLYARGKVDMALKRLAKLKSRRQMRPLLNVLTDLSQQFLVVRGKYQEGYSFLRQRRVKEADREFSVLLAADAKVMPTKLTSFYRKDVKRALAILYGELGEEKFKVHQLVVAFEFWSRGKVHDPENAEVLNGLLKLGKAAERLVREGERSASAGRIAEARAKLSTARSICVPGDPRRKRAEQALARLGK